MRTAAKSNRPPMPNMTARAISFLPSQSHLMISLVGGSSKTDGRHRRLHTRPGKRNQRGEAVRRRTLILQRKIDRDAWPMQGYPCPSRLSVTAPGAKRSPLISLEMICVGLSLIVPPKISQYSQSISDNIRRPWSSSCVLAVVLANQSSASKRKAGNARRGYAHGIPSHTPYRVSGWMRLHVSGDVDRLCLFLRFAIVTQEFAQALGIGE